MTDNDSIEQLEQRICHMEATLEKILGLLKSNAGEVDSDSTTIEISTDEIEGISDVLDGLESRLSDRQRVYLIGLFGAAAHHLEQAAGKEGKTTTDIRKLTVKNPDALNKLRLGDAFGSLTKVERGGLGDPMGPLADSVGVGVGVVCVGVDWSKDLDAKLSGSWRTNPAFGDGLANPTGGLGGLPGTFGR